MEIEKRFDYKLKYYRNYNRRILMMDESTVGKGFSKKKKNVES